MPAKVVVQSDQLYIDVRLSGGVSSLTISEAEQLKRDLSDAIFDAASLEPSEQRAEKIAALMAIIDPKQESEGNS